MPLTRAWRFFPWPLVFAVAGCAGPGSGSSSAGPSYERPSHGEGAEPNELLVRFRPAADPETIRAAHASLSATPVRSYQTVPRLERVRLPSGVSRERAIALYRALPSVLYAEPNYRYRTQLVPDDPRFPSQWSLNNTGQGPVFGTADADLNGPEGWDLTTGGAGAVVGVIDTGVDYTHEDLAANMWVNPGEIPGNGLDDDGDGYVDDVHGINAITGSGDPMDDHGHGTHVAGIMAAAGNNGIGVAGVAWNARIVACKFIDAAGMGTTADAIECLDYFHLLKTRPVNRVELVASNNSWGGGGFSRALEEAIDAQGAAGTLFVAAAGNSASNNDLVPFFPADHYLPNVIAVEATDQNDARAYFSSFGPHSVHVGAPGRGILSTYLGNRYLFMSGTSMAAPQVTGLLALLKAQDATRDWRSLKNLLIAGGQTVAGTAATTIGGRRIRAADGTGIGALTCSGQTVNQRVRPTQDVVTAVRGARLPLADLHLLCEMPAGDVTVTADAGGAPATLLDDGLGRDHSAGDGIYSGFFVPTGLGRSTLTFPGDRLAVDGVDGYRPAVATAYSWRVLGGTNLGIGDETVLPVAAPFPIHFGNHASGFTTLYVSGNGHVSFTESVTDSTNTPLPARFFQTFVAPFWDDLNPPVSGAAGVFADMLGTAPDREFVVEWRDVPHFDCGGAVRFQIVFFENRSDVLFNYADVDFGNSLCNKGASATVGVQVADGQSTQWSYGASNLSANQALLWRTSAAPQLAPLAATPPGPVGEGSLIHFGSSFTDPDGSSDSPWSVEWNFTFDGTTFVVDSAQTMAAEGPIAVDHVFPAAGTFLVGARVRDRDGTTSVVETVPVTVTHPFPPGAVSAVSPLSGSAVHGSDVKLTVTHATDPDSQSLSCVFEVFADPALSTLVAERTSAQPMGATTSVVLHGLNLPDESHFYWRARATDGVLFGPWSAVQSVLYDPVNDPPSAPVALRPTDTAVLANSTPTLTVRNATDPESDARVYEFQVRLDGPDGPIVARATSVPESPDGETSFRIDSSAQTPGAPPGEDPGPQGWPKSGALASGHVYSWVARAIDARGGVGPWSAPASFAIYEAPAPGCGCNLLPAGGMGSPPRGPGGLFLAALLVVGACRSALARRHPRISMESRIG